ncbi:MAG: glycosyltransferase family 4 protein [Euryarchaeota archaeon]|nr:glycosyltransferase family 4 protein [Euryarchaeota archaeon]
MACGKPAIAPKVGGIPYIVMDGKTGLLAHPGDVRGFADALIRILNNKSLASKIGTKAREWIVTKFSWNIVVPHIEQLQLIRK